MYPRIYGSGVPNFLGCQIYTVTRNKLVTVTLSWLSKHAKPSRSPILIAWKIGRRRRPVFGSGCWHNLLHTSRRTASFSFESHSSHTVFNAQVSCLLLWSLKLCNQYSCSHTCFKPTTCDFVTDCNTFCGC